MGNSPFFTFSGLSYTDFHRNPLPDNDFKEMCLMKLLDSEIKAAKPKDKVYQMPDGDGLVLQVIPTGKKRWRFRYLFCGKEKMLSLGHYPVVSLKKARSECVLMRERLAEGVDPSKYRQEEKENAILANENTFEAVALRWWDIWRLGKSEDHARRIKRRLEVDIFPVIGRKPVIDLTASAIVMTLKKIESRGASSVAHRAQSTINLIMRYAVAHGVAERNPANDFKPLDVLGALKKTHYRSVSDKELPELSRRLDTYHGEPLTRLALRLMPLVFVRTATMVNARWEEIELDAMRWCIPASRMKMRTSFIVPLSTQAIAILEQVKVFSGGGALLFPSKRGQGKSMDNSTLINALYGLGYKGRMTTHGFRKVASTILHERGYSHEHIELQLAHTKRNQVSAAYDHSTHLEARARMMQDWADHLDALKNGADVLPFRVA